MAHRRRHHHHPRRTSRNNNRNLLLDIASRTITRLHPPEVQQVAKYRANSSLEISSIQQQWVAAL